MHPPLTTIAEWRAIETRDPLADGKFFFAVRTTGVFCRPSCRSRAPLRQNVEVFATPEQARAAGYRPCKKCKPSGGTADPGELLLVRACRLLEADEPLANAEIARDLGVSASYFQRIFKASVGVTPRAYRRRVLAERTKAALAGAPSVTTALYDGGYGASSRFYEGAARELGMAPKRARAGAIGVAVQFAVRRSSLGWLLVAWTSRGVCDVRFGASSDEIARGLRARYPSATLQRRGPPAWVSDVLELAERPPAANIPLDIQGTAFQQRVWAELRHIPRGETRSYAEIARAVGAPKASRAVASACAANVLAVVIPCHRVVRGDGGLAGYRWGPERKRALLLRESAATQAQGSVRRAAPRSARRRRA